MTAVIQHYRFQNLQNDNLKINQLIKIKTKMYDCLTVLCTFLILTQAKDENILMSEVFEIKINPPLFNWTYNGNNYVYRPSLLNSPDLPSWINYVYSDKRNEGYLYGVPPQKHNTVVPLEIVALNKKNYETRVQKLNIHVTEKLNPARFEVHMKIDNVNVEDMFEVERMDKLKDIFKKHLWRDSESDLYATFLASAIELGARKPLNPKEGEGVVLRLGSSTDKFSEELINLQDQIKPLWKKSSCPREYKRTSVERYFRDNGFILDWCSFRLIDNNNPSMHQSGFNEKLLNSRESSFEDRWVGVKRSDIPERSYSHELIFTIIMPMVILVLLALVLSLILCFHHEGIHDNLSEDFFANLFHICTDYYYSTKQMEEMPQKEINQYATIHKATQSLRSLSNNRDISISPDATLQSHSNSPTSTVTRGVHCRPSPPPYVRPKFKPDF